MRESVLALATGAVIVAACASVAPYGSGQQAANTKGALYCWKDRLVDDSDKLVCNWAPSRYEACNGHSVTYVEKRLLTGQPSAATRCDNGQSLVTVTTG